MKTHNPDNSADPCLHSLVFLEDRAVELRDETALAERIHTATPLRSLVTGSARQDFFHRSAALPLGSLILTTSVHAPLLLEAQAGASATVAVAYAGSARVASDGQKLTLTPRETLLYLPGAAFEAETGVLKEVLIHLNPDQLAGTAAAMAGAEHGLRPFLQELHKPRALQADNPLRRDLHATLRRAMATLDASDLEAAGGFTALGLEDLLLRLLAMLLIPEVLRSSRSGAQRPVPSPRDKAFNDLLEWMRAHLQTPITLTQLEQRSAYSRRNLQILFQQRFGCGPMQWLKAQRLEVARQTLLHPLADDTVASIARRHGFGDLSGFAISFRRRFGIRPSDLLRQGRSRARRSVNPMTAPRHRWRQRVSTIGSAHQFRRR